MLKTVTASQWGHVEIDVELADAIWDRLAAAVSQWGHVEIDVELASL